MRFLSLSIKWFKDFSSKKLLWIIIVIWIGSSFSSHKWNNKLPHNIIIWDIVSYYSLLPATVIYGDLMMRNMDEYPEYMNMRKWIYQRVAEDQRIAIKYTCGLAILYLPFFFLGHVSSFVLPYASDGYSNPYQFWLAWSGLTYAFIGLVYLRKILKKYFDEEITCFTILAIGLGTNLYYYSAYESPMPHAISFGIIAMFLYYMIKWYELTTMRYSIYVGILLGLIVLCRPSNAIIILVPLLYGVSHAGNPKKLLAFLWLYRTRFLFIIVLSLVVCSPQFFYWKYITGDWFYYSYRNEKFIWDNPEIFYGLFSYRKGLLVYTPIYFFALMGILLLPKYNTKFFSSIAIFAPLNIYIIFSWWIWWYAGCFGQRPFVDTFALMALPMAACFNWMKINLSFKVRILPAVVISFTILNLFQTYQYRSNIIHWDGMNKASYWAGFGRISNPPWSLFEKPDYKKAKKREEILETIFD